MENHDQTDAVSSLQDNWNCYQFCDWSPVRIYRPFRTISRALLTNSFRAKIRRIRPKTINLRSYAAKFIGFDDDSESGARTQLYVAPSNAASRICGKIFKGAPRSLVVIFGI